MISSHSDNDDMRHWRFDRVYRHPIHVEPKRSPDFWVVLATIIIGVVLTMAALLGYIQ